MRRGGGTPHGLLPRFRYRTGPLRIVIGIRLDLRGRSGVAKTSSGHLLPGGAQKAQSSGSLGAAAHASLDVATLNGDDALYFDAAFRVDWYSEVVVWGPSAALGYRWDFVTRD